MLKLCLARCALALVSLQSRTAFAQPAFRNLAPNADGSALWFSCPLRLKGTDQFAHPKIFVWEKATGVRLYEQKPPSITGVSPGPTWQSLTAYNLIAPLVSSDTQTIAITGLADCNIGLPCVDSVEKYQTEFHLPNGQSLAIRGPASLSPN